MLLETSFSQEIDEGQVGRDEVGGEGRTAPKVRAALINGDKKGKHKDR